MLRAVLLSLVALAVLAPAAQARTCRSGETVYKRAGVRVFSDGGRTYDAWFACGSRTRRPVRLYSSAGGYGSFGVLGRRDGKVVFVGGFSGEGGGEETTVGWFDGRRARSGELAGRVSNDVLDVVVARDGGMGVVAALDEEEGGVRVGYLPPGRDELALAVVGGRYARGSLAFADGGRSLTWRRSDDGQTRTVPIRGERVTCTSGMTLLEHAGVRVFEVLPNRKARRGGFQADVLAACVPGGAAPRELAVSELYSQDHWDVRSLQRAGARIAFLAGDDGIGVLDGPALTFVRPKGMTDVYDVGIGVGGPPVFAGRAYDGGQQVVATLAGQRLATLGGDLEAGSLAVTDDGRVTWRTTAGVAQSIPIAGETALTCGSGTTLLDAQGVRVFETVGPQMRLLGCAPGMTAPATLLTGSNASSWRVAELAREHGFVALETFGMGDQVVTFGPGGVRAGTSDPYATIRDAALAPDGRIALALRRGRRWLITTFTATGRQRVLARPADGFAANSLAFDGTRVTWRNRAGQPRAA